MPLEGLFDAMGLLVDIESTSFAVTGLELGNCGFFTRKINRQAINWGNRDHLICAFFGTREFDLSIIQQVVWGRTAFFYLSICHGLYVPFGSR